MPARIPFARTTPRLPHRPAASAAAERSNFYSGRPWGKLRRAFLLAHPTCARCGPLVPAEMVHHRVDRLDRPDLALDWSNLESLCGACHRRHHAAARPVGTPRTPRDASAAGPGPGVPTPTGNPHGGA